MTSSIQGLKKQKQNLRKLLSINRNELDYADRVKKDQDILITLQKLTEITTAKHIFCFISLGSEPDTHKFIDWALIRGKRVSIPKITKNCEIIAVKFPGWRQLHSAKFGVLEPNLSSDLSLEIDLCLVPGIGFAENGNRLGRGGGYYDKWLTKYPIKYSIAPAFDCQVHNNLPVNNMDMKVDIIVTESRVIRA
ncbi:MAG: 5-formyltetrahydrofolate cyclo-ligase [Gammaproteobacteria bacterium]|jgi:5-formyltetrahydrofolate cyclo-ligase